VTALVLRFPVPGWGIGAATVTQWCVPPGRAVAPGDLLLTLQVDERHKNLATDDATKLLSEHWDVDPTGAGPDNMRVEVVADEVGILERTLVDEGDRVAVGDPLAVLRGSTAGVAEAATDVAALLAFRAVADVIERNEDLDAFL
jgi:pyruvate/2-oxoglutarate dehydrogenase complex dihydrolipoamide acyltransferase (E2) component